MFFISLSQAFQWPVRDRKVHYTPQGDVFQIDKPLGVQFKHGGYVPEWAREAVSRLPQFGKGVGIDEDPYSRIGWCDTVMAAQEHGWTPEEQKIVEDSLIAGQGVYFVLADPPMLPPPWPAYDQLVVQGRRTAELVAEKIQAKIVEDGYDPAAVLAYEQQNLNRPYVVEMIEGLLGGSGEPTVEEEIVAA